MIYNMVYNFGCFDSSLEIMWFLSILKTFKLRHFTSAKYEYNFCYSCIRNKSQ